MASEKSDHALKNLFSRTQIEAVIARLEGLASHANVDGMVSLKSCVPFMSFSNQIAGMLEGKIPLSIIKKEGEPTTLEHLRVDAGVVRAIAGIGAPGGYISANGVTTRIAAVIDTVQRLAARGVFETAEYQSGNGLTVTGYSKSSVDVFVEEYITFRKLARSKANWAATEIRIAKIRPAYDFGGPERIYRRDDLLHL